MLNLTVTAILAFVDEQYYYFNLIRGFEITFEQKKRDLKGKHFNRDLSSLGKRSKRYY